MGQRIVSFLKRQMPSAQALGIKYTKPLRCRLFRLAAGARDDRTSFLAHAHYRDHAIAPVSDRQTEHRLARLRAEGNAGAWAWEIRTRQPVQSAGPTFRSPDGARWVSNG